jgi:hypothetical protein
MQYCVTRASTDQRHHRIIAPLQLNYALNSINTIKNLVMVEDVVVFRLLLVRTHCICMRKESWVRLRHPHRFLQNIWREVYQFLCWRCPTSLEEAKIFLRRTIVEIGMKIRLPSARLRSKSHSQQRPPAAPPWPWPLELEKDSLFRSSRRHPKLNSHTQ